jgi:hypothetical protein
MTMRPPTIGLAAAVLLAAVNVAGAQGTMQQGTMPRGTMPATPGMSDQSEHSLNDQQKQAIWQAVGKAKNDPAPASFQASVGADIPRGMKLHKFPASVSRRVPDAGNLAYAKIQDQILIVDPSNK